MTKRHPDISCPIRFDPDEKPLGTFVRGMSRSLCFLAHSTSYCFNAFELGPAWAENACRQYLNQPRKSSAAFHPDRLQKCRADCGDKPNLSKTIIKIVLGQQLELTGVALLHKGVHFFGKTMAKVGFGVTTQVCGTFADTAKLLYL